MASRSSLSAAQRAAFEETGVLHVPGLVPRAMAETMAGRLWRALESRNGLRRNDPRTWTKERPAQLGDLRRAGAFAEMASPGVRALLDDFFAPAGWRDPGRWGQALVTFPSGRADWTPPGAAWHLDVVPGQLLKPWPEYVRVFAILAPLEPGGGGTAYVAGSHHLTLAVMAEMRRGGVPRSATVRERLKLQSPWIAALCSDADDPARMARLARTRAAVRGVELAVGEMTGEPGDVVLMHPATLHAGAPNCRETPRLMLAESIYAA